MDGSDPAREAIHEALQKNLPRGEDAILTGWVLVAEWIDHDGEQWLSKGHAAGTAPWTAAGMLHEALHGTNWPREGEDE